MKKTIIIGVIITIIGSIIAFVGLSNGASTSLVWNNGLKINKTVHTTKTVSDFKNIQLDSSGYEIEIKSGTNYSVEVKGSKESRPKISVNNDTLTVTSADTGSSSFGFTTSDNKIIITVPNGTILENINGSSSYSELELNNITTNNIDLDTAGSLEANNLTVKTGGHINGSNSGMDFENSNFTNVTIKNDNGSFSFENGSLTGGSVVNKNGSLEFEDTHFLQNVTLNDDNGTIEIDTPTTDGYQLSSTNGSIELFDKNETNSLNQNENATNKIIATTKNGSIEISN